MGESPGHEYMGRELFMFCLSFWGSESDILFNLVNQHYSKGIGNHIVYNKEYVYARILFTNDQTKWTSTSFGCFSRSTAFIVDFTSEVNCNLLCNNYRPNQLMHPVLQLNI